MRILYHSLRGQLQTICSSATEASQTSTSSCKETRNILPEQLWTMASEMVVPIDWLLPHNLDTVLPPGSLRATCTVQIQTRNQTQYSMHYHAHKTSFITPTALQTLPLKTNLTKPPIPITICRIQIN